MPRQCHGTQQTRSPFRITGGHRTCPAAATVTARYEFVTYLSARLRRLERDRPRLDDEAYRVRVHCPPLVGVVIRLVRRREVAVVTDDPDEATRLTLDPWTDDVEAHRQAERQHLLAPLAHEVVEAPLLDRVLAEPEPHSGSQRAISPRNAGSIER